MNDLLFKIGIVFATPQGWVICGTSPHLDLLEDSEIATLLQGLITVDLPTGRSTRRVLAVKSSTSLIGKKNVHLLLSDNDVNETWCGRDVFLANK